MMDAKKRLSIIVPVYNVEPFIERCLRSILNQDIAQDEYEIIVVDDGTPDRSAEIAQRIADENENIVVIHRENGGLSAARNTGLEHIHGRYVFFVDSDDYIEPKVLSAILQSAESRELEMLSFTTCRREMDGSIKWQKNAFLPYAKSNITDGISTIRKGLWITSVWSFLYRVDLLKSHNFRFKEGIIHEDIEFNYRVLVRCKRVCAIDLLVYNYCMTDTPSITRHQSLKQKARVLTSNMEVAASIKHFIRNEQLPADIYKIYDTRMNSMLVSNFLFMLRGTGRKMSMDFIQQYISNSKRLGVYPINGFSLRKKTKIIRLLLNKELVLRLLARLSRK